MRNMNFSAIIWKMKFLDIINEGNMNAGHHHINWEAHNFSSGIYLLKVEQGHSSAIQKLILIK